MDRFAICDPHSVSKMIKLSSVRKKFATTVALHETDLCISGGKTTVLIGPSGCGKSTILRLIVGLLEPTTGTIEIDGDRVSPANILALRRRIGYVIQEGGLFAHLTARQNVLLMAKHLHRSATRMETRLRELCELTHFPECTPPVSGRALRRTTPAGEPHARHYA
jgi:osmoprotectant transport system ATP-binding protein